jgi:phosphoribosylanthranilate isomerase
MVLVKICGINDAAAMAAALEAGADMVGLVFFEPSPRHLTYDAAEELASWARGRAEIVALTVDADDARIAAITERIGPDVIQLHGRESPERVRAVAARAGCRTMKALGISVAADLDRLAPYAGVADLLLLDARPPKGADRPGGHGAAFDWTILERLDPSLRYMLSGGLTPDNVAEAIRRTRPYAVDVSSGVERSPGVKAPALIEAFVAAARGAAGVGERHSSGASGA